LKGNHTTIRELGINPKYKVVSGCHPRRRAPEMVMIPEDLRLAMQGILILLDALNLLEAAHQHLEKHRQN
jgi:hypothetical protein